MYILYGTSEHHRPPCVGFSASPVRVQDDGIPYAEIRHAVVVGLRKPQYDIFHSSPVAGSRTFESELVVDIACRKLVLKGVVPCGGKAGVVLRLVADLRHEMLVGNECEEPEIIRPLQFRGIVDGVQHGFDFRFLPSVPQGIVRMLLVQLFRRQNIKKTETIGLRIHYPGPRDAVSHLDGLEQEFGRESESQEALLVF